MTLAEIRRRTREQSGDQFNLDAHDDPLIDQYVNEGFIQLCGARMCRETSLTMTGGRAPLDTAPGAMELIALIGPDGSERSFHVVGGNVLTDADGTCTALYLGTPDALAHDDDVPALPERFHGALADYATWRVLSAGGAAGQNRAQYFFARFQLACLNAEKYLDAQLGARRIRNKFA